MGIFLFLTLALALFVFVAGAAERWSEQKAQLWQKTQGYRAGTNFVPSTAVNELEMFQAETYDTATIDRELGWMQNLGFNTARVFLHNILYDEDKEAFFKRLDDFLTRTSSHGIKVMFVLLDSCWNSYPQAGTQPEPIPGVHNSQV
ncbi:hypothetical protein EON63_18850 [archaeon]|nr:MAG: hypothetical protein EON63_18850 [archaeon]